MANPSRLPSPIEVRDKGSDSSMARLTTAMDSAFWDQNLSSPLTLEGTAYSVPGDPFPVDGSRASRALRVQQLSLLGVGFPLGIIPSVALSPAKQLGSLSLQSLLLEPAGPGWWLGVVGQLRPKKLISSIKAELSNAEEWDLSLFKDATKHILDKSLYAIGLWSQLSLGEASSMIFSTERHGDKKKARNKLMFFHKLPNHDITLEAARPQLFIDHKGQYWNVPESISLDLASLTSDSGFRYRFGIHKSNGHPQAVNDVDGDAPSSLMPGVCAKAAFSYEMHRDFWRQKENEENPMVGSDAGTSWVPSYDVRLREPHAAISGVVGGTCTAWFGRRGRLVDEESQRGNDSAAVNNRSLFSADLFGSICYTFQHGKFKKLYGDLSRVDARLDVCSVNGLAEKVLSTLRTSSASSSNGSLSTPRLNLIFQQQVAGPIVFRVDSQYRVDNAHMEDLRFSLSYSLRLLRSGKVVAWYSPKRKEGMIELRIFEF